MTGNPRAKLGEEWTSVPGSSAHLVSSHGRVWSKKYSRLLVGMTRERGYSKIKFSKDKKAVFLHRVVASCFVPNPLGKPHINHKDGNPSNSRADNLEWVTHQENVAHAKRTGLLAPCRKIGMANGASKLTDAKVVEIRRRYASGELQVPLAKAFGVSQRMISLIVRREKWTHV
jgi:hypothetical protein